MKIFTPLLPALTILAALILKSCVSESQSRSEEDTSKTITESSQISTTRHQETDNLNISIFLDLSDRINPEKYPMPAMEIYKRDQGYIQAVSQAFEEHLKNSKIRQADENMQIFFEPEPMNSEINRLAQSMKLHFDKSNISKDAIAQITPTYQKGTSKIYELALADHQFVGSDIWTFFKNKVKDYCIEANHRNILIILTDGYMFHQDNRIREGNQSTYLTPELISSAKLNVSDYKSLMDNGKFGFIPATSNLHDLEVLILGIHPVKGKNFEEEVIKAYWADWLKAMGVKTFDLKGADLPSNLKPVISKFLNNLQDDKTG